MYGYIYKTTEISTGKIYVGKHRSSKFIGLEYTGSGTIVTRIREKALLEGKDLSEVFTVEMIDTADTKEELNEKEIYWIDKLDARNREVGYNLRKGGDCGPGGPMFTGHKHTEESKKKISRPGKLNGAYGKKWHWKSYENRYSMVGENNSMYGKHHKDSTKQLIGKANSVYYFSNKETDTIVRIPKDQEFDEEELYKQGFVRGNWHHTDEYRNKKSSTTIESISDEKDITE